MIDLSFVDQVLIGTLIGFALGPFVFGSTNRW